MSTHETARRQAKPSKAELAQAALAELLSAASRRGFHGTASLSLVVQDGHIQHLRVTTEKMVR